MPLAPAATRSVRFSDGLRSVRDAHAIDPRFVDHEIRSIGEGRYAKTAGCSLLGLMNEFTFLGNVQSEDHGADGDPVALSASVAETPMSPLYKRHISPDHELKTFIEEVLT